MNMHNAFPDTMQMIRRNLLLYFRLPQLVVFSSIQPVMFVLFFVYVFGGTINTPGVKYVNYLLPGILVQTVLFGSMMTGIGLAADLSKGIIERFRSLPIWRGAVLAGRTISDVIRNIFVILLMTGVGYAIGYRFQGNFGDALLALFIMLLFGFAFSWISALIGIAVKDVETAQSAGFIWVVPLVFASSIFVPVEGMPKIFRLFAENSPITYTVDAVRRFSVNQPVDYTFWASIIWLAALLITFIPLAVRQFRKIS